MMKLRITNRPFFHPAKLNNIIDIALLRKMVNIIQKFI